MLLRIVFALETRLIFSVPLFTADFLSSCCCCCFFFFCFFFVTFGLPESDETSSDVVLSQKASRWHDRGGFAFAPTQVVATVPTPRNFRRCSNFHCDLFGDVVDAASSFNESASIVRKEEEIFTLLASLILESKFIARCQSSFEFFFFDVFCPSVCADVFSWDAFFATPCRFRRDFFRVFLTSSLSSS